MLSAVSVYSQDTSILSTGQWARISILEEGVYKLRLADLNAMGFDTQTIDPRKLALFGNGGKMLDQVLESDVGSALKPLPILVSGEEDGVFNASDYILFYGESPHSLTLSEEEETFVLQKNYYSDTAFYYLTVSTDDGKRIAPAQLIAGDNPIVTTFDDALYQEDDFYNRLTSGREWFGHVFNSGQSQRTYSYTLENLHQGSVVKLTTRVMAYSFESTDFDLSINGIVVGNIPVEAVSDYTYDDKGVVKAGNFSLAETLISSSNIDVGITFNAAPSSRISDGFLDQLILHTEQDLIFSGQSMIFSSLKSLDNAVSQYEIEHQSPALSVWDVSDREAIEAMPLNSVSGKSSFNAPSSDLRKYVAFDPSSQLLQPIRYSGVMNQDILVQAVPDLLIVTHEGFRSEAERLANFRATNDGLDVLVVSSREVFNEFSAGIPDPTAIRNIAAYFYNRSDASGKLKSLLIVGRGSYDYKNIVRKGNNFVPIYESRESLDPLKTYGSDDYFGFLEVGEGDWLENSSGNHSMDIGVGRLPVKSLSEARNVVDKLIRYSSGDKRLGSWRNKVLFVADDGDFNLHQDQSNQLSVLVDTTFSRFDPIKVFLDNYNQEPRAGGEKSLEMTEAISRKIEEGALIVNFTGHGGEAGWAQESILDEFIIEEWQNIDKLPLFVTATCEFGRHDNPARISAGEKTLLSPNGGSVGLVSTSRPVFSSTNFQLNKAFYNQVFEVEDGEGLTVGEVFRRTKNASLNGVSNRNFSFLGDPSMRLSYPKYKIEVLTINEQVPALADTVGALSTIRLQGRIVDHQSDLVSIFNGVVDVSLFDKQQIIQTKGDENPPYSYADWQTKLFKGSATVSNGLFTIDFRIPKNIVYTLGEGKISMYAVDKDRQIDATGTNLKVVIGGDSDETLSDTTPPEIKLYMNDESFLEGGVTSKDPELLVKLYDENGINISGIGVGQDLEAVLDGELSISLNDYYAANTDDFQNGSARYKFFGLSEGKHSIKVLAWDTFNNQSESILSFNVLGEEGLSIGKVRGAPNPFTNSTVISVEHNRPGQEMEVVLEIYNSIGRSVIREEYYYEKSPARMELKNWDGFNQGGEKIEKGIYIVSVSIRSISDGAKNRSFCKLIYLN